MAAAFVSKILNFVLHLPLQILISQGHDRSTTFAIESDGHEPPNHYVRDRSKEQAIDD
ncbi:hypothetical protein SAMN05444157_3599 [Frankineae bacterium MT45]|nr:hypothetical protein SAMN05444157_3599 [Frankineae bacterium MT45]